MQSTWVNVPSMLLLGFPVLLALSLYLLNNLHAQIDFELACFWQFQSVGCQSATVLDPGPPLTPACGDGLERASGFHV